MVYESEIGLLPNIYFHRQLTHPALSKPPTPPYPPSSHGWAVTAGHKNLYNPQLPHIPLLTRMGRDCWSQKSIQPPRGTT